MCGYRHTVEYKGKPPEIKRLALQMYLEGFGFRSIGRILKVSNVAVMKWIKSFGEQVEKIRKEDAAKIIEMDEMHTYIQSKKTTAGYGLLLIDLAKDTSTSYLVQGGQKQE